MNRTASRFLQRTGMSPSPIGLGVRNKKRGGGSYLSKIAKEGRKLAKAERKRKKHLRATKLMLEVIGNLSRLGASPKLVAKVK